MIFQFDRSDLANVLALQGATKPMIKSLILVFFRHEWQDKKHIVMYLKTFSLRIFKMVLEEKINVLFRLFCYQNPCPHLIIGICMKTKQISKNVKIKHIFITACLAHPAGDCR